MHTARSARQRFSRFHDRERSESGPKPKAGTVEQYTATVGALTAEARCKGPLSLVKTRPLAPSTPPIPTALGRPAPLHWGAPFSLQSPPARPSAGPPTSRNSGTSSASASHSSIHRSTGHCFVAHWLAGASTANARPTGPAVPDTTAASAVLPRPSTLPRVGDCARFRARPPQTRAAPDG